MFPNSTEKKIINFYNLSICVEKERALEIFELTMGQNTIIVWHSERAKRITASNCYTLYTYSKNKNPNWPKKIATYFKIINPTKNMKMGNIMEPVAIRDYEFLTEFTAILPMAWWIARWVCDRSRNID